ncbi:methyl-cpg-binding domain-containing protein 13 [Phtheirospermum japonicum]|uniref:Methyl-cpg-binding domain-containing protein 13 n=1 Tax=Phtheirospermum japonicum TaxID=374723 RepID=A0A830BLP0_9LAMI|nr:methyl-cpg-binding domain-containing protein 13 [Phtheirospermum japonicum]
MVVGKSPEWLPSGFTEKVKYKNGRRIKYYYNVTTGAKYFSKKDVLSCATSDNGPLATPQTPNGDDNALSSGSKVDAESDKTNDSPDWLPDGWTTEERTRNSGSRRGSVYKVYTEASSGKRFYSRASVTQYLGNEDRVNTVTSENVVEQLPHMSPQCLSMTNTGGTPEEKTKGNSFHTLDKVDEAFPKCLSMTNTGDIPEEENKDNSIKTLDKLDEPSPKCLSMTNIGGILEEENKDNFIKMPDKVDEPSPVCISMTNIGGTSEEVKKDNSVVKTLDKVDDPSPHLSMKNTGAISGEKKKGTSYKPVAVVSSADDDLPPGWIKEIVTSKCGIKTRRDPYYTDPVSGYVFRSKLDALRYVKTNDIRSCAIRPKKRESTDLDFFKNDIPSPSPAHEKLPEHNGQLFVGSESNGREANSEPEAKISNQTISNNNDSDIVKVTENNPKPENGASKDEPTVTMDVDASITSPLVSEKTPAKPKNPRKRKTPSVPSRTSKRLSRTETETQPDTIMSEHSLRATAKTKIEPPNEVDVAEPANEVAEPVKEAAEPAKEAAEPAKEALLEHALVEKETPNEIEEQPKEVERNPPNDENPVVIPEQIFHNNNDDENKQESSQFCFDFGDTWSVPLDFALKTLRGEIPIDDTLAAFPGCYNENLTIPFNDSNPLDGCVRPSQSDVADIFRNEVDGSSKQQQSGVDPFTGSSSTSFSALGNFGFSGYSGFNNHSSTDVGKNDGQTKFNP